MLTFRNISVIIRNIFMKKKFGRIRQMMKFIVDSLPATNYTRVQAKKIRNTNSVLEIASTKSSRNKLYNSFLSSENVEKHKKKRTGLIEKSIQK